MMNQEVKLIALETFHKEACAKGITCSLDEAMEIIEKQAEEETRRLGLADTGTMSNRLLRRSDSGLGKYILSDEAMKATRKSGARGALIGLPLGGLIGALVGKKYGIPARWSAGGGGYLGALTGYSIGSNVGKSRYLADKGLKLRSLGLTSEVPGSLAREHLGE